MGMNGTQSKIGVPRIAVLDAGGQYCHLIARKIRELGVLAEIMACETSAEKLRPYAGIVISGGPASVFAEKRPKIAPDIFDLNVPVLGICYGHQLIAEALGGKVQRGEQGEYGIAELKVATKNSLFKGLSALQPVWMNHRDTVDEVPKGFETIGGTHDCKVAAMADFKRKVYGIQFHPEVVHTRCGNDLLENFVYGICHCRRNAWKPTDRIADFLQKVREEVRDRNVFFLVSGGVDSTVAFGLCVLALGKERVKGLYIDTGFMRKYDTEDVRRLVASGMDNIEILDMRHEFVGAISGVCNPETKRKRIGKKFLDIAEAALEERFGSSKDDWVLGQGTIYPDTIESGGTKHSAHIKTHHNRIRLIRQLIEEGRVVEPLRDLYKDEVRLIGQKIAPSLNLPNRLILKHPFPGPGLAIRCLASKKSMALDKHEVAYKIAGGYGLSSWTLSLRTVGIKGDERSYDRVVVLSGETPFEYLQAISTSITNRAIDINRVALSLSGEIIRLDEWHVAKRFVTAERVELLREADNLVMEFLERKGLLARVWQFPVILIPFCKKETSGETVVLRPVDSVDGMTAEFSKLDEGLFYELASILMKLEGIDAVLLDITNKPPATIEWE